MRGPRFRSRGTFGDRKTFSPAISFREPAFNREKQPRPLAKAKNHGRSVRGRHIEDLMNQSASDEHVSLPTEPIGSIPRPLELIAAVARRENSDDPALNPLYDAAIKDTSAQFRAIGSPVITDGGTTDDCGFSPACDDTSTSRETAFAKIQARVAGTAPATAILRR
jgi:hypothetical protein